VLLTPAGLVLMMVRASLCTPHLSTRKRYDVQNTSVRSGNFPRAATRNPILATCSGKKNSRICRRKSMNRSRPRGSRGLHGVDARRIFVFVSPAQPSNGKAKRSPSKKFGRKPYCAVAVTRVPGTGRGGPCANPSLNHPPCNNLPRRTPISAANGDAHERGGSEHDRQGWLGLAGVANQTAVVRAQWLRERFVWKGSALGR
jgi:hypothetical protein